MYLQKNHPRPSTAVKSITILTLVKDSPTQVPRFDLRVQIKQESILVLVVTVLVYARVVPGAVQVAGYVVRVPAVVP